MKTNKLQWQCLSAILMIASLCVLAGCMSPLPPQNPSGAGTSNTSIDWVNFVRFNGITYLATPAGRNLTQGELGPVFDTVKFRLQGQVSDPQYKPKDGDAAFLNPGTPLYSVKGYVPSFRLATHQNNSVTLYEASANPKAKRGADLLDIHGKVRSISITSATNGTTQLASITNPTVVTTLTDMIQNAPIEQNQAGQGSTRYFLVFHLIDGTTVTRVFWPDSNMLADILLPKAFSDTIKQALPK